MVIRGELITPESDLVDRTVYNGMFTMHGTVMLFLWTFPSLVGFANYLVPLMIGATRYGISSPQRRRLLDGACSRDSVDG